ncbi:hypothetical protein [Microbispora sp. H13382]|uniref:hypothetical protein n=1 Tax=Microbispora sp. H13382 TaxID=2729112 RepID=UPI00160171E9|nr:hypothetical protein [Microbispora sp. H13382]
MPDGTGAILAEIEALAKEHEWRATTAYLAALPSDADPALLVLPSAGTDAGPLSRRLREAISPPDATVTIRELESLNADPVPALAANRVVVALQCGQLLTSEAVEAAALVLGRPAGTYAVVLVGAEIIHSEEDLDIALRGVSRLLFGDSGDDHCFLFTSTTPVPFLAERVARDQDGLTAWLTAGVPALGALRVVRANYALDLAEQDAGAHREADRPDGDRTGRRLRIVREAVAELRGRLLKRVDADLATVERQIVASLQMLEQDLLGGIAAYLAGHRQELAQRPAAVVERYIEHGVRDWRDRVVATVAGRIEQIDRGTQTLFQDLDWNLVNERVPRADGRPYPDVIVDRVRFRIQLSHDQMETVRRSGTSGRPQGGRSPEMPTTLVGGVLGVTVALTIGTGGLGTAVAAALGATGGNLVGRYLLGGQAEREAADYAGDLITRGLASVQHAVHEQMRGAADAVRTAVREEFDALERGLTDVAPRSGSREAASSSALGSITGLRRRLDAAHL